MGTTYYCAECRTPLSAGMALCPMCGEIVPAPSETTPSAGAKPPAPPSPPPAVEEPTQKGVYTRWKKTPTTFGPLGRITGTLLGLTLPFLLLLTGTIWGAGVGVVVAVLVSAAMWRRGWHVPPDPLSESAVGSERAEAGPGAVAWAAAAEPVTARSRTPASTVVAWATIATLVLAAALVWMLGDGVIKTATALVVAVVGIVAFVAWSLREP